tara:strand:- start:981 stop:1643 length:663 start_codon:yes stop_codon:yes gene_type:complete
MINKILFTSYMCDIKDNIIQIILHEWRKKNPTFKIIYFSDNDIQLFFKDTPYEKTYKKLKNGVAIADFFRICYIYTHGGYWFDIDLEPFSVNIPEKGNIHLFDCGYKNISYMFIGGIKNKLFEDVIKEVTIRINKNVKHKTQHIMDITGPRIIQDIVFKKLKIINKDGNFPGHTVSQTHLEHTDYEFEYLLQNIKNTKTQIYKILQNKYKKLPYQYYNYI